MLHKHGSFCFKLKIVNLERNWYIDSTVAVKSNDLCLPLSTMLAAAATAAAKSLQSCPTLCDPIDSSPPGSPSLGFSRQEHWSGLPLLSSMQESEK